MTAPVIEAVTKFRELLEADDGLAGSMESLKESYGAEAASGVGVAVRFLRAPAGLEEKAASLKYPLFHVYCDRIETERNERFRSFSGRMRLVAEVRMSQDRLDGLAERLQFYVDAVRDVVERQSGCVGGAFYLDGNYEVTIEPVKKGGLNFTQTARVCCQALINRT